MRRPAALITAASALVLWIVFCLYGHAPKIEAALHDESRRSLATAGLPTVHPDFSGRAAVLSGTVASRDQLAEAERVVAGVEGVVSVDNRLEVTGEPEPQTSVTYLEIRSRQDGVTLRGPVPSEALRQELVARARQLYGGQRVDDLMVVDPAVEEGSALASAMEVLGVLAGTRQEVEVRLEGDSLRLSGTVSDREARRRIEEQTRAAAPRINLFFSALRVAAENEPGEEGGAREGSPGGIGREGED